MRLAAAAFAASEEQHTALPSAAQQLPVVDHTRRLGGLLAGRTRRAQRAGRRRQKWEDLAVVGAGRRRSVAAALRNQRAAQLVGGEGAGSTVAGVELAVA